MAKSKEIRERERRSLITIDLQVHLLNLFARGEEYRPQNVLHPLDVALFDAVSEELNPFHDGTIIIFFENLGAVL